jgi:hypothetical protein
MRCVTVSHFFACFTTEGGYVTLPGILQLSVVAALMSALTAVTQVHHCIHIMIHVVLFRNLHFVRSG